MSDALHAERLVADFDRPLVVAAGVTRCVVCAPKGTPRGEIVVAGMRRLPGVRWEIFAGGFADGKQNPTMCMDDTRREHWLLVVAKDPAP